MTITNCRCGAELERSELTTCPLCGAPLAPGAKGFEIPKPEALATLRASYQAAFKALAADLAAGLQKNGLKSEAAWDWAVEAVKAFHDPSRTPHAWIFGTRLSLALSDRADDAMDERTSGSYDWEIPDPSSAARAVAEHDVLATLGAIHDMED